MSGQRNLKSKKSPKKRDKTVESNREMNISTAALSADKIQEENRPTDNVLVGNTHMDGRLAQVALQAEQQAVGEAVALRESKDAGVIPPVMHEENQAQTKRVSFVVRLFLDNNNQFERTEIEHIATNRKQKFLGLHGEHLVTFMKECIAPLEETDILKRMVREQTQADGTIVDYSAVKTSVVFSNIQLFNARAPTGMDHTLRSREPFILQVHFQVQGRDAQRLTTQEPLYALRVYARELSTGKSDLCVDHRKNLVRNILEYTIPVQIAGLSQGLYRLLVLITIETDSKLAGYHDGPIIQVI